MRKTLDLRNRFVAGGFALALALMLFGGIFCVKSFVSHAESQGKITAASVVIRKEPSTSSEMIGSTEKDKTVSIVSQVQGADGYTWYQVFVNADTKGYIRADLLEITDGTTPPAGNVSQPPASTPTPPPSSDPPATNDPPAEVTDVNPVSATVIGENVSVYDNASTTAQEIATVQSNTALTVTGQAADPNGTNWYRVNFLSNEVPVEGFILSVYVHLSGELTPPGAVSTPEPTPPAPEEPKKQYETIYVNDAWQLYNVDKPEDGYPIEELLKTNKQSQELYAENQKSIKNQKVIIIVLVFLLVSAVAGIAFLVFKIRDMMDSAYFSEVENETLRKRTGASQGGGSRVMHTVGTETQKGKPVGARQAGASPEQRPGGASQGQRPSGAPQRPSGAVQGQRPMGASQGQRAAGASHGQRPAGAPQGQRPTGTSQVQRPAGGHGQSQRPAGAGQRPSGAPQGAKPVQGGQKVQPKNFIADDEEFEFEFLNYDGDDE